MLLEKIDMFETTDDRSKVHWTCTFCFVRRKGGSITWQTRSRISWLGYNTLKDRILKWRLVLYVAIVINNWYFWWQYYKPPQSPHNGYLQYGMAQKGIIAYTCSLNHFGYACRSYLFKNSLFTSMNICPLQLYTLIDIIVLRQNKDIHQL